MEERLAEADRLDPNAEAAPRTTPTGTHGTHTGTPTETPTETTGTQTRPTHRA
jgi:hypothetical protein